MLAIRMQRTGRKGHSMFRVIVQESHRHPTSGRVVAILGSYNPHSKEVALDKEKVEFYLKNGAQPSERAIKLFETEKIKLPEWITKTTDKKKAIRNPEKLRRNQPKEEAAPEVTAETDDAEKPAEESTEATQ